MTEGPVLAAGADAKEDVVKEDVVIESPEEFEEPQEAEPVHCRHCGAEGLGKDEDWLCTECGRYQDTATCPVCKQPTRLSLLPKEHQPEAHTPKRRRKSKED